MGVREDTEFDRPHGVQTEISGLREWLGLTSWEERREVGDGTHKYILSSLDTATLKVGEHSGMALDFRSRWRDESCIAVRALREDDPMTTLDGLSHGEQWREIVVSDDERKPAPKGHLPHLVQYQDFGVEGIGRWIALRDQFVRALDPVITSNNLRNATPQTRLAHTSPGVEALGTC